MMAFNERLRKLRKEAGLTQEDLARASGLSVSWVSKLEQQELDPAWSTVVRLADGLGVSVEAFVEPLQAPGKDKRPRGSRQKETRRSTS